MTRGKAHPTAAGTRRILPAELEKRLPELVDLLEDVVRGGASLGFLPPLARGEAREYWLSLRPELHAGSRVLLATYCEDRIVGSGQLELPPWPNARHRAELQKLFVGTAQRGQGVGRSLVAGLHEAARQRGRSLLLLKTRRGGPAERFYHRLGYQEVGVVPGYTVGPTGERYDNLTLYQEI